MAVKNSIGEARISLENKSSHKEVTNIMKLGIKALQGFGKESFLYQFQPANTLLNPSWDSNADTQDVLMDSGDLV